MKQQVTLTRQAIRTPRAAAVAGIIFSVLFTISMVLIRLALPEELRGTDIAAWLQGNTTTISLALTLVPFAGIAFLWFVALCVRAWVPWRTSFFRPCSLAAACSFWQ